MASAQQFPEEGHYQDDQGVAQAYAQPVKGRVPYRVIRGVSLGTGQDDAVDDDKRNPYSQPFVYGLEIGLEEKVHDGHEGGDDHDEDGDAYPIGYETPDEGDDHIGGDQDEDDGQAHKDTVLQLGGYRQRGAKPHH